MSSFFIKTINIDDMRQVCEKYLSAHLRKLRLPCAPAEGIDEMAIYHCSMKSVSRGAGQSIVAAAAYRHACKLENSRTGEIHDYSRKRGLESSQIYLPSSVKLEWAQDRSLLWNAVETAEKRKNARLGRELVLALPAELTKEQRRELAGVMARRLADRYGLAVDVAIHQPSRYGDNRNHHAHMLMSSRRITPEGFGEKARELDDHERGPIEIEHIRAEWARLANRALERAGQHVKIDHRSFQRQGKKRMPPVHLGPSASAMERRDIQTRLGNRNRAAQALNAQAAAFELEQRQIEQERRKAALEEKTHPGPVLDRQKLLGGMEAFKAGYLAHKREEVERKRKRQEEQERIKKRAEMAQERLKATKRWLPIAKTSSDPERAFAGHYRTWFEERGKQASLTLAEMQHADWIVSCRMLAQGHDPEALKEVLHRCSPAAALEERESRDSNAIVDRALKQPEVQEQRKEALQKKQEQERSRSRSGPSMGR